MTAAALLLDAAALALHFAGLRIPGFADRYAAVMNPVLVGTLGRFSGLLPFSLAELLLFLIPAALLVSVVRIFRRKLAPALFLKRVFLVLSVIIFLFVVNEDIYFKQTPLAVRYGLERDAYTTEELTEACRAFAAEAGAWAGKVERDEQGLMVTSPALKNRVRASMQALGKTYPVLSGWYPAPKGVLASLLLSYSNFTGVYSMFTIEANYNRDMVQYNVPFTMCHELSHLRGITSEKEANYVGWLACMRSEDPDLHYSGTLLGWIYLSNELYARDRGTWYEIASSMDPRVNADLDANTLFWDSYRGTVSETTSDLNDTFLKAEGLKEGVDSYDLVVDLIVTAYVKGVPDVILFRQ